MSNLPSLSEIDRLHAAATPGLWERECGCVFSRGHGTLLVSHFSGDENLDLVVALRNAWPAVSEAMKAARRVATMYDDDLQLHPHERRAAVADLRVCIGTLAP